MKNIAEEARKAGVIPEWPEPPEPPASRLIKEGSFAGMVFTLALVGVLAIVALIGMFGGFR